MFFFGKKQIVLLLGPTRAGKSELILAMRDLQKLKERGIRRIMDDPESPLAAKAKAAASHMDDADRTPLRVPLTRNVKFFKSSLSFKDGAGATEWQVERVENFIKEHIAPKPKKWKRGVLAVIVFDICDIIADDADKKCEVESTYRDLLEVWAQKIHGDEEEEESISLEDEMRGKKVRPRKRPFRPPLSVIFVSSHLDCAQQAGVVDAKRYAVDFVDKMEKAARNLLEFPPSMGSIPPSRTIPADLYSQSGRLNFAMDLKKALEELSAVMSESLP